MTFFLKASQPQGGRSPGRPIGPGFPGSPVLPLGPVRQQVLARRVNVNTHVYVCIYVCASLVMPHLYEGLGGIQQAKKPKLQGRPLSKLTHIQTHTHTGRLEHVFS
jgi:hypothetical protein